MAVGDHHFPAQDVGIDGGVGRVGLVQLPDVAAGKVAEAGFGIFGGGDARPAVEVGLRIVQSPGQVEPHVDPRQVFGGAQQPGAPFLLSMKTHVERPRHHAREAQGDEQVAHGKGHRPGHVGQQFADNRVDVPRIGVAPARDGLGEDDGQQQDGQ